MKLTRDKLILLAILLIGLFLRIYDLGNESIWINEGSSIRIANLELFHIVEEISRNNVHPPFYYIILHYWINLFGDSEFSTRFLSVIFGFFAIFMIFKLGKLIFDKDVGILSSLLLGLSVYHIHYSQEVKAYSLMALLSLLSIYFFVKILQKSSLIVSIGYVLSSILLIYTHNYGLFIIIAQNIYFFTRFLLSEEAYKLSFKRWILLQLILIALFLPWISILMEQLMRVQAGKVQGGNWIPVPSIYSIINTFVRYSGSKLLFMLFLTLSFFSIINCEKIKGKIFRNDLYKSIETYRWKIGLSDVKWIYLLALWILTPIILPFIISKVSAPIYWHRYSIAASLAFYILAAKGIRNINYKHAKSVIISIIIVFSLVNIGEYYTKVNKEQWRDVADYIDANAKHGDLLLFNAGFCQEDAFDYYSKRTDLIKKPFPEKTDDINEENIKELEATVEGHSRVWVILSHSHDYKGLIKKALGESFSLSHHEEYVGIKTFLFEKIE